MSILRIFKKDTHTDPAMLAKQADEATAIHSITVPKYRVKGNFVEYVVECSRISTTWQVYRRYQQFKALDQQLKTLCPMGSPNHCEFGVIPVLASTHWTEVTNQSPELVERRRRYLEIYLQQLLCPKNLFYAAKTALYNFLHDGEVPILHKSRNNRPLPGFGMLPPSGDNGLSDGFSKNVASEEVEETHKQVVAVLTTKAQQNVHSSALPDLTKNKEANSPSAAFAPSDPSHIDPLVGMPPSEDAYYEKCTRCGTTVLVDYEIEEWVSEGRCAKCKEHSTFVLISPAERKASNANPTTTASTLSVPTLGTNRESGTIEGLTPTRTVTDGDELDHEASSESSDDETEVDMDDDRRASIGFACNSCRRMFDLALPPRRCYMCASTYCRNCSKKVPKNEVDKAAPFAASPAKASADPQTPFKEKAVRLCDRCYTNHERHKTNPISTSAAAISTTSSQHTDTTLATSPQSSAATIGSTNKPASIALPATTHASASTTSITSPPVARTKDIALSDFALVTTLGRGTFGKVIKVKYIPTGEVFAMKVLNKSVIHKRRMVDYIREEKNIMTYIPPHPYICTCHYTFQTEYHVFFVLDYLCGGELYTHIYPNRTISESDARLYIAEIILGVEHMHKHDVCHRDLKPENIVLDRDGHLKITDFGLARMNFSKVRRRSFVGSAEYLAPETIQGDVQTKALDWWSVGVMLYELLCGVAPFHAATNNEVYQSVLNKKLDFATHRDCFSANAQNLISKMLEKDLRGRLVDPEKIKHHPFFEGLDWGKVAQRQLTPPFVPNLEDNDTKYFNRDFTSEWATIRNPQGVGRQTAEMLTRRFSNFKVVPEIRKGPLPQLTNTANNSPSSPNDRNVDISAAASPEGAHDEVSPSLSLINPSSFVGVWRLVTVEMTTSNGQTCYPWGSEAIGILKYTDNGLYALQLCPMKRPKFKNASADKITRDELADAYLSYVGSFGTYEVMPGKSYISQTPTGALCPNSVGSAEKWYFELLSENRLRLMTSLMPAEEGMVARTVVTWERVSQ